MVSKVALVRSAEGCQEAIRRALTLIGGIDDLNVNDRVVTIKVGVYDHIHNHPTSEVTKAVAEVFDRAPRVFLAESDNRVQETKKRLQIYSEVFGDRVLPFNLTEDKDTRDVMVVGERVNLSHILFKPNVRVSLHSFRCRRDVDLYPQDAPYGPIIKNLLGTIPDIKKDRFHDREEDEFRRLGLALVDIMEAIGGIDLAVMDATYAYYGKFVEEKPLNRTRTDLLLVGRDAVAVDAVGLALVGRSPLDCPSIAEAARRGLGEAEIGKIEILGESLEKVKIELPE